MRERPILFSGPMVHALLAGRKSVTRRVVKEHIHAQADAFLSHPSGRFEVLVGGRSVADLRNRFGVPGDRLWVRETWASLGALKSGPYVYRADTSGERVRVDAAWRPSIHMHRAASRLTLEVTSVRVERLHDISEADAKAEGVERHPEAVGWLNYEPEPAYEGVTYHPTAGESFASLWRSINGAESWDVNPWVWVVSFNRAEASK